jgi:hypothetical protein
MTTLMTTSKMAIQCGYVTMFAGAMPTAATVACLYTLVEMYSDLYKLVYLTKRPQVVRAHSIGVWAGVIQVCSTFFRLMSSQFNTASPESFHPRL